MSFIWTPWWIFTGVVIVMYVVVFIPTAVDGIRDEYKGQRWRIWLGLVAMVMIWPTVIYYGLKGAIKAVWANRKRLWVNKP